MKVAVDSCSMILLSKSAVLEIFAKNYDLFITEGVYKEILKGKDKKFIDALLTEGLVKERKIKVIHTANNSLIKKLMHDFGVGIGEAETLALVINKQCDAVLTDNKQGRKSAFIHGLSLIGSVDGIISLHRLKLIDEDKAVEGLKRLREFGWFSDYLIDKALEDIGFIQKMG